MSGGAQSHTGCWGCGVGCPERRRVLGGRGITGCTRAARGHRAGHGAPRGAGGAEGRQGGRARRVPGTEGAQPALSLAGLSRPLPPWRCAAWTACSSRPTRMSSWAGSRRSWSTSCCRDSTTGGCPATAASCWLFVRGEGPAPCCHKQTLGNGMFLSRSNSTLWLWSRLKTPAGFAWQRSEPAARSGWLQSSGLARSIPVG